MNLNMGQLIETKMTRTVTDNTFSSSFFDNTKFTPKQRVL